MKTIPKVESPSVVGADLSDQSAWKSLTAAGRQHYAHPIPTLLLAALVPVYFIINASTSGRRVFAPELALDRAVPLKPVWILVYISMWVFALLPAFLLRNVELRRRAVLAYITVALVSYVGFLVFPTVGQRPARVLDEGFFAWSLQFIYDSDPPYNCFPSLHVAYAFVAALTCYRIGRGLGIAALSYASLIGMSTLFIKQHYVIDVVAGALSAYLAYLAFLRRYARDAVAEADCYRAPLRVLAAVGVFGIVLAGFWIAYNLRADVRPARKAMRHEGKNLVRACSCSCSSQQLQFG